MVHIKYFYLLKIVCLVPGNQYSFVVFGFFNLPVFV